MHPTTSRCYIDIGKSNTRLIYVNLKKTFVEEKNVGCCGKKIKILGAKSQGQSEKRHDRSELPSQRMRRKVLC